MQENPANPFRGRLFASILLVALVAALLIPGIKPMEGRWMEALWNLLHLPGFFLLSCLIHSLWPGSIRTPIRFVLTIGCGMGLGLATEWTQTFLGRSGNWGDVAFDALGIWLAVIWLCCGRKSLRGRIGFSALVIVVVIACLWPAWGLDWAEAKMGNSLPHVGGFENWETRLLWRAQGNATSRGGEDGLRVRVGQGRFGGVSFQPGVQDWSSFRILVVEIENPEGLFELGIRIDDSNSRTTGIWFSDSKRIEPGENRVEVSLQKKEGEGRTIDFARVSRLALFTGEEEEGREFFVKSAFLR